MEFPDHLIDYLSPGDAADFDSGFEKARLEALYRLGILDTPDDIKFDRVTRLAQRLFNVEISLVSIVDAKRQWFKSCVGLEARETPRSQSFCSYVVKHADLLLVPDASQDPRFCKNPLVTGPPNIRMYAAYPIHSHGQRIGSLCIIDSKPRTLTDDEISQLQDLTQFIDSEIRLLEYMQEIHHQNDQLEQQNDQLEQQLEMKDTLVSMANHDIINTLNPALGLTSLLMRTVAESNPTKKHLRLIYQSVSNTYEYVSNLFDLCKITVDRFTVTRSPVMVDAITSRLNMSPYLAIDRQLDGPIDCDPLKVSQVLNNLISNALNFIPRDDGLIVLTIGRAGEWVEFTVSDNGPGVPVEKQSLLFQKFGDDVHPEIPRKSVRTGLGLYICRMIAEAHDGSIEYLNDCDGGCFRLRIPA